MNSAMERLAEKRAIQQSWKAAVGFLLLELMLIGFATGAEKKLVNASAILWGLAWLSLGAVPGFLFGIPKVLQRASEANDGPSSKSGPYSQLVNTNLEQVSDWLTKILLGAGLVQLQRVPAAVGNAATYVARGLGPDTSDSFAASIIVLFTVEGFLVGYLGTRLLLARAFRKADMDGLSVSQAEALGVVPEPNVDAKVSKETSEVAEALAQTPLSDVRTADLLRWAQAQRVLGNKADALRASRMAAESNPNDLRARLAFGIALYDAHQLEEAFKQLCLARDQVLAKGDKELAAAVYGWLTFVCVYRSAPDGFTDAIKAGEEFLARKMPLGDGSVLVNLAAAYGQKARHMAEHGATSDDDPKKVRNRALELVKLAVSTNKGRWLDRVRELLVKDMPGKNPDDNDLEIFEEDPEFWEAVSLKPPPPKTGT